jgi:hypothetical protein
VSSSPQKTTGRFLGAEWQIPFGPLALAALAASADRLLVAVLASLVPLSRIGQLAPPTVLAAE